MTRAERAAERRAMVIEETEHLLGTDTADSIAVRLGYKDRGKLMEVLNRWGRNDLSRRMFREAA